MKFNIHLLSHIALAVKYFGALWAWSIFIFESYNMTIKLLYHGTQFIPEQICKMYCRLKFVMNKSDIFDKENSSERAKQTYIKLMKQCKVKNCIQYHNLLKIFGKPQKIILSLNEKVLLENHTNAELNQSAEIHHRFIYKNL